MPKVVSKSDRDTFFGCNGVQIVPAVYPPTVYYRFAGQTLLPNNSQCNPRSLQSGRTYADKICFPVQMKTAVPLLPDPLYIITDDPEDPAFYSTCYFRIQPSGINSSTAAPPRLPNYQFQKKCVDCKEAISSTYEQYIPTWNISQTCIDCEKDGPAVSKVPVPIDYSKTQSALLLGYRKSKCTYPNEAGSQAMCPNGTATSVQCTVTITTQGVSVGADFTAYDCYLMAKKDPRCQGSKTVFKPAAYLPVPQTAACECWVNTTATTTCCGPCVPNYTNSTTATNRYEMFSFA